MDLLYAFEDAVKKFKQSQHYPSESDLNNCNCEETIYRIAVISAYNDFLDEPSNERYYKNQEIIINQIVRWLWIYVEEHRKDSSVHGHFNYLQLINRVADVFIKDSDLREDDNPFGLAQYVINLSFKYLYCFNSEYTKKIDFSDIDIRIDNKIAYFLKAYKKTDGYHYYRVPTWKEIGFDIYQPLQDTFKEALKGICYYRSAFENEFIAWYFAIGYKQELEYKVNQKKHRTYRKDEVLLECYEYVKQMLEASEKEVDISALDDDIVDLLK